MSLDQKPERRVARGMGGFLFLPHVFFVAEYGLEHLETSRRAKYVLTRRFPAEFSIRRYLERHQAATLVRLTEWSADASEDVRRLVSEGTRPRLPWAANAATIARLRCAMWPSAFLSGGSGETSLSRSRARGPDDGPRSGATGRGA